MSHETSRSLEKDGYRAQLAVCAGGRMLLRSRRDTDMTASFPEFRAAALAQLPEDTGLDGVIRPVGVSQRQGVSGGAAPADET